MRALSIGEAARRWYDAAAIQRIDMLKFAQQAGFTLKEIKVLFDGFGADTPLSARWQSLARKKLTELEAQAKHIKEMQHMLRLGLKCGCIRIEDCAVYRAVTMPRRRERTGASRNRPC